MIRLSCPQCGKAFKVMGEKMVRAIACPRCGELVAAPLSAAGRGEPERQPPAPESEPARGVFRGMSTRVRWAVAGVVGVAVGGLLLGGNWAVPLVVCSTLVLLVMLHGQGTGCPACGRWWSRVLVKKELVDRELIDEGGAPCEGSVDRTTYRCAGCWHRWAVTDDEAARSSGRGRPQPHRG